MEENNQAPTSKAKLDKSQLLIIMRDGKETEILFEPLQNAGYRLMFCASINEAFDMLPKIHPSILIHDWELGDQGQATAFHQRLLKNEEYESLCRILLVKEVTEELQAISIDCAIRRLLTKANAQVNILEEIKMALAAETSLTAIQIKVRDMRNLPRMYDQGEIDQAVEEAYSKHSHDPAVKLEFGNLCTRRNQYSEAETIARFLLRVQPANVRASNLLARCLMKTGHFDDGIKILEHANSLSPNNPERLIALGQAFLQKGEKVKASEYLVEALEIDPKNNEAAVTLGDIALEEGDAKFIMDMFRNSLSEEEVVGFFNNAAVSKVRQNNYDDALSLYEMAFGATITQHLKCIVQFNIGLALRRMHDLNAALRVFKRCLRLDPNYEKANQQVKEIEAELKKSDRA